MPISWDELEAALKRRKADDLYFEPEAALKRLENVGDVFSPVLTLKQSLPESVTATFPAKSPPKRATALREYARKRDFTKTVEPRAARPRASAQGSRKHFVVQKRAASHLHYDFGRRGTR
jgi:hypothetical protein